MKRNTKINQRPSMNPSNLRESDSNPPPNIKVKKTSVNCYLFEKNNPFLLEKAKQANHDPIDFTNGLVDIAKHLVTFNHLPPTRYGEERESRFLLVTSTDLQTKIDHFLAKIYDPSNNERKFWIIGPSGNGKSFAILNNVLRARRSYSKEIILVHVILSDSYLNNLSHFFFNDLVYAFYPLLEEKNFPKCPEGDTVHTDYPLRDWMVFLANSLVSTTDFDYFYLFFLAVQEYCAMTGKQFLAFIGQTNFFMAEKKNLSVVKGKFMSDLISGMFFTKTIISNSYDNDNIDSSLNLFDMKENVLKTTLEGCFNKEQIRQYLKRKCNFDYDDHQLEELIEVTGSVPFEIWEFSKIKKNNFYDKKIEYIIERKNEIEKDCAAFYHKHRIEKKYWEKDFLENFFLILDTKTKIPTLNFEEIIDRKYMFVKDKKLCSVSPITKEFLIHFYSKIMLDFDEEKKIYLASYYQKLYQEIDAKNDPQLRNFLFEQLIINQMLRKEKNKDIHLSYYHKSTQIKHLSCDFRKLFSTTRT